MWLPAAERTGEIHFRFARSLPYRRLLWLAFGLMAAGLAVQVLFVGGLGWLGGVPLSAAGMALLLVAGYSNTAERTGPADGWRSARKAEVERILEINRKQTAWDQDAVDVTNGTGLLALAGVLFGLLVLVAILPGYVPKLAGANADLPPEWLKRLRILLVMNFLLMVLPFWFTGTRSVLKNGKLVNKVRLLLGVAEDFARLGRADEVFEFQLQTVPTTEGAAQLPVDIKAAIRFPGGRPDFLGVQMQVAINSVQGSDYPYFYCVLVATPGSVPLRVDAAPDGMVVEPADEPTAQVVVIRRKTTKNSGYHTGRDEARRILAFALAQARVAAGSR